MDYATSNSHMAKQLQTLMAARATSRQSHLGKTRASYFRRALWDVSPYTTVPTGSVSLASCAASPTDWPCARLCNNCKQHCTNSSAGGGHVFTTTDCTPCMLRSCAAAATLFTLYCPEVLQRTQARQGWIPKAMHEMTILQTLCFLIQLIGSSCAHERHRGDHSKLEQHAF